MFQFFFIPFSLLYAFGIALRNFFYDNGIFRSTKLTIPVMSVGNISVGGTGKTPHVEYLARLCQKLGKKVAVVSRGYKRKTKGMFVVSDGETIFGNASDCGDEPLQLARAISGTVIIVDENRVRAAEYAQKNFFVEVIILDDGFQHRKIERSMDIVIIDAQQQDSMILPAGRRREPWRSLKRSDAVILSRWLPSDIAKENETKVRQYSSTVLKTKFEPKHLRNFRTNETLDLKMLVNEPVVAFCGIGSPRSFQEIIIAAKANVQAFLAYADHHYYSERDCEEIIRRVTETHSKYVVTTEKDAARLTEAIYANHTARMPLFVLEIDTQILEGEEILHSALNKLFTK